MGLEAYVDSIIAKGKPWTDNDFKPTSRSILDPAQDAKNAKLSNMKWKRASEIYTDPKVFAGGIHPNDINQGALGDCYFLCVLSSLAERPNRVEHLFYTKEINEAGCYLVYFFINGAKTPVMVDDHFPINEYNQIAFSSSKDDEIWVSLLEKAWAKLHGSYARIESGVPYFAYSQLCGLPGYSQNHKKLFEDPNPDQAIEYFWQELVSFDRRNFVMLSATHG